MKKLFLMTALVGMFAYSANAQAPARKDPAMSGIKLGAGFDFGFPTGDYSDYTDYALGGSLNLQVPVASKLNFVGEAGYLSHKSKEILGSTYTYGAVPLKAGLRYFIAENFYAQGQIGASISTEDGGKTGFLYAPSIGVEFPLADKLSFDFGARYEGWTNQPSLTSLSQTNSFIGLRAALNFGL